MSKIQHSDALEARARKIVEALGGTWSRTRGMCCCPAHPDRTPSLSITLGKRAILVHCFAGCANEAVIQAMARHGVRIADLFDGSGGPVTNEPRVDTANRNAFRLWLEASALAGTPAERYLAGRGITISSPEMRFHPRMPLGPKGVVRFLPALVAAIRNDACILAVGRIFLDPDTGRLADFEQPKRSLGSPGSGAVTDMASSGGSRCRLLLPPLLFPFLPSRWCLPQHANLLPGSAPVKSSRVRI